MIYFAYGSNLRLSQMRHRCPDATPLGSFFLRDSRLVFRMVADCEFAEGETCPGGLYRITPECEDRLDRFEGIGTGAYRKEFASLTGLAGEDRLMFYVTNSTGIMPPPARYLAYVAEGYRDFGLPLSRLRAAVEASHRDFRPTYRERRRYHRQGRPLLAGDTRPREGKIL